MYALLRRVLLFSSFTLFSNFEYGFFDITVLVDDEDLGECNGSTTAGLGKREDRHTGEENRYYLSEAREVHELVKLFLFKVVLPTCWHVPH